MKALVDTCVWSLALRRRRPDTDVAQRLKNLIGEGRVVMIGPIRQEILSGIGDKKQFAALRDRLSAFEDIPLTTDHFVLAAEFYNTCLKRGIQGSGTDYLICAVACNEGAAIYTVDKDFDGYRRILPIQLL